MKRKWRLIIDPPRGGAENMATDEALLLEASSGRPFSPVLRIYEWSAPTLSVGYLQDTAPFLGSGVPLVRRITGGRAILHDNEVTYALIVPSGDPLHEQGVHAPYAAVSLAIILALGEFGLEAEFARPESPRAYRKSAACFASSARHEVLVNGRKIAAGAQRRVKGGVLLHGSIIFGMDESLWTHIFGEGAALRTSTVLAERGVERGAFRDVFVNKLVSVLGADFRLSDLREREAESRDRLVEEKYSNREWNWQVSGGKPTGAGGQVLSAGIAG